MTPDYCSTTTEYHESWKRTIEKYYEDTNVYAKCTDHVAEFVADFEPVEWFEIWEHPSSISVLCKNKQCKIEGDLITPPPATGEVIKLLNPVCSPDHVHHHAYTDHVHFECEANINDISRILDHIAYIGRKAEQVIPE